MQCLSEKLITNTLLNLELDPAQHTKERWAIVNVANGFALQGGQ